MVHRARVRQVNKKMNMISESLPRQTFHRNTTTVSMDVTNWGDKDIPVPWTISMGSEHYTGQAYPWNMKVGITRWTCNM